MAEAAVVLLSSKSKQLNKLLLVVLILSLINHSLSEIIFEERFEGTLSSIFFELKNSSSWFEHFSF